MEIMDNQFDGKTYRCWKVILEVLRFIDIYEKDFGTINLYRKNFIKHISRLIKNDQLIIKREDGVITGICGWVKVDDDSKQYINKITWMLPECIDEGHILYITICINSHGNIQYFRRFLKEINGVSKVFWFNMPKAKFTERKILKEEYNVRN